MNTPLFFRLPVCLAIGLCIATPAHAQKEDEKKADLQSYSVGDDRRPIIDQQEIKIERPTFDTSFDFKPVKPSLSNMQIAKPRLEVIDVSEAAPAAASSSGAAATPSTAGSGPAVNAAIGSGETRSVQPLSMEPPDYPRDALRAREEGFVVVEFTVNAEGATQDINVVEAQPRGEFERAARRAVERWRFEPALRDGRPVSQRIRHTIEFTLGQ